MFIRITQGGAEVIINCDHIRTIREESETRAKMGLIGDIVICCDESIISIADKLYRAGLIGNK